MTRLHVTISLLCLAGTAACSDAPAPRAAEVDRSPDPRPSTAITDPWIVPPPPEARPRIDIYGNPVEHAVGEYRVDPYGEPYDAHAPDTALPALGPAGA